MINHVTRGLIFVATLAMGTTAIGDALRVITLKHRPAEELIPVIRPLLPPTDAVSGTDYRLLVRTSEKNFKDIERMVAQLDVARRNLTLTVRQVASADADRVLHALKGEKKVNDQIRIKLPRNPDDDEGLTVGSNTADNSVRYHTKRRTGTVVDDRVQVLRVQEGQRAFIRVGQSVPHMTSIRRYSGTAPTLSQGVEFQNVTTGFDVLPRLQGDTVHLVIAPRVASLENPNTGLANVRELSTTISVKRGEWIDLGSVLGYSDEVRRAVLESAESTAGERLTFLLKAE